MYYSPVDIQFWLFSALFVLAVVVSCYVPGWLLIRRAKLTSALSETALSVCVGLILWVLQGYLLGYAQIRWATYAYILLALFFVWKERSFLLSSLRKTRSEISKLPVMVKLGILAACIFQLFGQLGNGFMSTDGIRLYFVNEVDGMMHLSYIQALTKHFPAIEPGAAGTMLTNYHYLGDFVSAEFARVWQLPVIHLFSQYMPVLLVMLTVVLIVQLVGYLRGSTTAVLISLFLFTFGADAAFLFTLYFNHNWGYMVPSLDSGVTFLFNMPQVYGRLFLIAALHFFLQWRRTNNRYALASFVLLSATLVGFKVYYGLYCVLGFGMFSMFLVLRDLIARRHTLKKVFAAHLPLILAWIALAGIAAAIYLPTNAGAGGLIFLPLLWPKLFLEPQNINYNDWALRMQVYTEAKNYRNIAVFHLIAIGIMFVSIYGVRLLGFFPSRKTLKSFPKALLLFVIPTNVIFFLIALTFIQRSGGLNVFNFFIVPMVSLNLFTAFTVSQISNRVLKTIAVVAVVALCIPRTYIQFSEFVTSYVHSRPGVVIPKEELELFAYIRDETPHDAVIQPDVWNEYASLVQYTSFFSHRSAYMEGDNILFTHTVDVADRQDQVDRLFSTSDPILVAKQMRALGISYMYVTNPQYRKQLETAISNPLQTSLEVVKHNGAGIVVAIPR